MSAAAVLLIVVAAVVHAVWNLLSKQASQRGGVAFVWLVSVTSTVLYAPLAVITTVTVRPHLGAGPLLFIAGTAVLHAAYFTTLQRGYRAGDLSLVYPLARGIGPLLASLAAVVLMGERPGAWGWLGIILVSLGVIVLGLPDLNRSAPRPNSRAVFYGVLTGVLIATYTIWDSHAVSALAVPPLLYMWGNDLGRALLMAPFALRQRTELGALWGAYRRQVVGTAILSPLSYILVLTALSFSAVSAIAPARELSVLFAVLLGGHLLSEERLPRRVVAAVTITAGVIVIALGH